MADPLTRRLEIARELLSQFKLQQALSETELALASLENDSQDIASRAQAHELAGRAASGLGRYPLAEEHLRQAILLLDELEASESLLACQLLLAEMIFRQGQLRAARHLANTSLQKAQQEGWEPLIARSLICLGNLAWVEGEIITARDLLVQAVELFDKLQMPNEASRARCSLGVAYTIAGDNEKASELLLTALAHFQQERDYAQISRCLNNLAGIFVSQADYSRAREYLLECVELETEIGARGDMANSWFNLGLIELSEAKTKVARKCLYRALQLAQEAGDRGMEGSALLHLGINAIFENESTEAFNLAQLAASAFEGSTSQHAQTSQHYMPLFSLASGDAERGEAEWSKLDPKRSFDHLERRTMAALLIHLSTSYSEPDQAVTSRIRGVAHDWAVQLLKADEA